MSLLNIGSLLFLGVMALSQAAHPDNRQTRQIDQTERGVPNSWHARGQQDQSSSDKGFSFQLPTFPSWFPTFRPWGSFPSAGSSSSTMRPRPVRPVRPVLVRPTRRPTVARSTTKAPTEEKPWDVLPSTTQLPVVPEVKPTDDEPSSIGCGTQSAGFEPQFLNKPNKQTRVINGQEAKANSWPWVVAFLGRSGRIQCGGSLLRVKDGVEASDIVLTAAHCVANMPPESMVYLRIAAGRHRLDELTEYSQESIATAIRVHPKFGAGGTISNDVALIKLDSMITFNDGVRPVCLPQQGASIPTKQMCVAAGWGRNSSQNFGQMPEPMQQVIAPAHSAETCKRGWGGTYQENAMVCAGELNGESGVCNGDSGSTLMCKEGNRWVQHGVVSFGVPGVCLEANKPDVYARVSSYTDWIKQGIKEMSSL